MDLMEIRRAILTNSPPTGSNIFNWAVPLRNPSSTAFSNATKRVFTPYTYCIGTSWSNYYNAANVNSFTRSNGVLTVNSKQGYGVGFAIPVKRISSVGIQLTKSSNGIVRVCFYDSTGEKIIYGDIEVTNTSVTVPDNAVIMEIVFCTYVNQPNTDATFENVKIKPTYSIGGLPVYANNACFYYRNGLVTDYLTDNDFFIAGPFDTGSSESKSYLVSRYVATASGNVVPCLRPYNSLSGTSLDYYAIGASNAKSRAIITGGQYIFVSLDKSIASTAYMYDRTNGRYVYKGNGIKTYDGLPVYIDNAYYAGGNGYANSYTSDDRYFIAGPFDTLTTSGKLGVTFNRYTGVVGNTVMRTYNDLTATSADFWAYGGATGTRQISTPGQYYLVSMYKDAAKDAYMTVTSSGLYIFKGTDVT